MTHTYIALPLSCAHKASRQGRLLKRARNRPLRPTDRAMRAMDELAFIDEEQPLERARDQMLRLGVRASLVQRDGCIIGLITEEAARAASRHSPLHGSSTGPKADVLRRVEHVMLPIEQIAAIDWALVEKSQVFDLARLFEGRGTKHLLIVMPAEASCTVVRGLIHRDRIRQPLVEAQFDDWPSWCMRTGAMEY